MSRKVEYVNHEGLGLKHNKFLVLLEGGKNYFLLVLILIFARVSMK